MTKGIIVIDIPKNCAECPCYMETEMYGYWCGVTDEEIYNKNKRDCPIKPMPEKIEFKNSQEMAKELIAEGWNACIDKILAD